MLFTSYAQSGKSLRRGIRKCSLMLEEVSTFCFSKRRKRDLLVLHDAPRSWRETLGFRCAVRVCPLLQLLNLSIAGREKEPPGFSATVKVLALRISWLGRLPPKGLIAILKESRYGLVDFMFKHGTVLMLFLGWIVSSDRARQFLSGTFQTRVIVTSLIISYFIVFILAMYTWKRRSENAFHHLVELEYMPVRYYSPLRVTAGVMVGFIGIHGAACTAITILLFFIY